MLVAFGMNHGSLSYEVGNFVGGEVFGEFSLASPAFHNSLDAFLQSVF